MCLYRSYRHAFCCHRDYASRTNYMFRYWDWGPFALWASTMLTAANFMQTYDEAVRSVLCKTPGWTFLRTKNDSMHCTNLGIAPIAIANSCLFLAHPTRNLAEIVVEPMINMPPDADLQTRLSDLEYRFMRWKSKHKIKCSVHRFTLSNMHAAADPHFTCKAAKSPILIAWLAELTRDYADKLPQGPPHKKAANCVANCIWGLAQYYHICRNAGRFSGLIMRNTGYRN